jgi:hypothetical protein
MPVSAKKKKRRAAEALAEKSGYPCPKRGIEEKGYIC